MKWWYYPTSTTAMVMSGGDNAWTSGSDERLKKDITDVESRLEDLLKLKVKRFKWKKSNREDIGLIAQEAYEHCPEAVYVGNDEVWEEDNHDMEKKGDLKKPWGMQRERLLPMVIKAIQELSAKVTALENA